MSSSSTSRLQDARRPIPLCRGVVAQSRVLLAGAIVALVACGGDVTVEPVPDTLGPEGGKVTFAESGLTLTIPPGALSDSVTITVQPAASFPEAPTLVGGTAYELQPADLTFARPVELSIAFDGGKVPSGVRMSELRLFEASEVRWTEVTGSGVSDTGNVVVGQIRTLGIFGALGVPVASVAVLPTEVELMVGATQAMTARVVDRHGTVLPDRVVTWTSANPDRATVDANGIVAAHAVGTVNVSAQSESVTGNVAVDVCTYCWRVDSIAVGGLLGVWGTSAANVYAVGNREGGGPGLIVHFDGESWSTMGGDTLPYLTDVYGSSATDIYAVGSGVLHYDGTTWTRWSNSLELNAVWVAPGGEMFAVGEGMRIERWIGGVRQVDTHPLSGTPGWLQDVWGNSASDVYAVGRLGEDGNYQSVILHWDGDAWGVVRTADAPFELNGVWGPPGGSSVFAVGQSYDGQYHGIVSEGPSPWTDSNLSFSPSMHGISGTSASDVIVVAGHAAVQFDGTQWQTFSIPMRGGANTYYMDVWAAPSGELFLVGTWSVSIGNPALMAMWRREGFGQ